MSNNEVKKEIQFNIKKKLEPSMDSSLKNMAPLENEINKRIIDLQMTKKVILNKGNDDEIKENQINIKINDHSNNNNLPKQDLNKQGIIENKQNYPTEEKKVDSSRNKRGSSGQNIKCHFCDCKRICNCNLFCDRLCDCECDCRHCREHFLQNIFMIINIVFDIIIIVLLIHIHKWTVNNPLENIILPYNISDSSYINNDISSTQISPKEIIYKDVNGKNILRFLDDNCNDFNEKLEDNNYELDKVFKLKFKMVHKMSLGILIIYCINFGLLFLILISIFSLACIGECCKPLMLFSLVLIGIVSIFSGIVNLILFIIMMVNYYKGNTTGEFLDFYNDCCNNEISNNLEEVYEKLNKLNKHFTDFVVLNFIEMSFNIISNALKKKNND